MDLSGKKTAIPLNRAGYQLLHEGTMEMARIEATGIKIDVERLRQVELYLGEKLVKVKESIRNDPLWEKWTKRWGRNSNIGSREQLGYFLFDVCGVPKVKFTKAGSASVDEEVLDNIQHPDPAVNKFIHNVSERFKYDKTIGTFLKNIRKYIGTDGRIHPVFDLFTAKSYRGSCSDPNFQAVPNRDKEISELVRGCFIPSTPERLFTENDFSGIEVAVSAAYHQDANFISYITTPGKDMHRDTAAEIFGLRAEDVSKDARQGAKNTFVFPQFYGANWTTCAPSLWDYIDRVKLTTPDKVPLKDHLRDTMGIHKLGEIVQGSEPAPGTFAAYVRNVEKKFWNERFKGYSQWKRRFFHEYQDRGSFDILSGFRIHGVWGRTQVCNYPIQGSAFHCLLWSIIQIGKKMRHYKFKSRIIGQIHDSVTGDIVPNELANYLDIVHTTVTEELREHFTWLKVPMKIENETSPQGEPWSGKREYGYKDGKFQPDPKNEPHLWTSDVNRFMELIAKKPVMREHRMSAGKERGPNFRSKY